MDRTSEPDTEPSSESDESDAQSDDDRPTSAALELTAVAILRESWGPPPGRGVKPEEVYTQRYYTVLLSNEKKENILAEDNYEGLQHQSADANPFYAKVVSNWREDHETLPVPPRPDPKGKKKANRS